MVAEKSISTIKLFEYLKQEIARQLLAREIHDIGHYGWLDEITPDPQLVGHAMWQVEPPLQYAYLSTSGRTSVCHRPTEKEEVLAVSGHDFEGLMRLTRISLGLGLWQQQLAEDTLFKDNDHFWVHYLSAMVMLNAASDRLRDFFVMAFFGKKISKYERKKEPGTENKYRLYQTPFIEAMDAPGYIPMGELLDKLAPLAREIADHRKDRNKIVHKVATKIGRRERDLTHQQQRQFDEQQDLDFVPEPPQLEHLAERLKQAQGLHKADLSEAMDQTVLWYKTLVQASSYVFEVENRMRRQGTGSG